MAELAKNLHKGELSKLERDRQIARYVELCGSKGILHGPRAKSRRGRPEGGLRAVARNLDIAESTARGAMEAANITDPAAAVVTELGLADNPTAYRAVAAEPTAKAQIARAREIAGKRAKRASSPAIKSRSVQADALMAAWKGARAATRREFLIEIGHEPTRSSLSACQRWRLAKGLGGNQTSHLSLRVHQVQLDVDRRENVRALLPIVRIDERNDALSRSPPVLKAHALGAHWFQVHKDRPQVLQKGSPSQLNEYMRRVAH